MSNLLIYYVTMNKLFFQKLLSIIVFLLVLSGIIFFTLQVPDVWSKFFELLNGDLTAYQNIVDLILWGCVVLFVGIIIPLIDVAIVAFIILAIAFWLIFRNVLKSIFDTLPEEFMQ